MTYKKTILNILDVDNNLHQFEMIDDTLTDNNIDYELILKIARELGVGIVDYWVSKEYKINKK